MIEFEELARGLATSPDFIMALSVLDEIIDENPDVNTIQLALYFFTHGYKSCMEFAESQKQQMTRPFRYQPEIKND